MKIQFLFSLVFFGLVSTSSAQSASAIVQFEQDLIELGKVTKGDKVKSEFVFTNISDQEIEIDMVSTCDCTEAKWTYGKIKPGEKGKIRFTFDSSKKDDVVPIELDVYFLNIDPKTDSAYSKFLSYTFQY